MALDTALADVHLPAGGLLGDPRAEDPADRLMEESWTSRQNRAPRRELVVETTAAALFLAAAIPLALPAFLAGSVDLPLAGLLVTLYALAAGTVRFPIGAGYLVPTWVILVPMLLLLPPATVPVLAALAWLAASLGRLAARRGRPEHVLMAVPNAWHTLGPAAVLVVAGTRNSTVLMAAIYILAFSAGCVLDLVVSSIRESAANRVAPQVQLRVATQVWLIDGCIAPLGLLLALAARHDHRALLTVLPREPCCSFSSATARIGSFRPRSDWSWPSPTR